MTTSSFVYPSSFDGYLQWLQFGVIMNKYINILGQEFWGHKLLFSLSKSVITRSRVAGS